MPDMLNSYRPGHVALVLCSRMNEREPSKTAALLTSRAANLVARKVVLRDREEGRIDQRNGGSRSNRVSRGNASVVELTTPACIHVQQWWVRKNRRSVATKHDASRATFDSQHRSTDVTQ